MQQKSLSYASYWRDSLADVDLGKGAFRKKDLDNYHQRPPSEFTSGLLDAELSASMFKGEAEDTETVAVLLRPYAYECHLNHGKHQSIKYSEIITPIVATALVDRQGRLFPLGFTVVPRDILEPLDRGSISVGNIDDLDAWLTTHPHPLIDRASEDAKDQQWHSNNWSKFTSYVKELVSGVTGNWPSENDPYLETTYWLISKESESGGSSVHILPLYDHLLRVNPASPLFDQFASEAELPVAQSLAANTGFGLRLGHASDTYPLANAQRDAMTHHLASQHGEILGVNGPPGTGKTTLLLSIVASHMVKSAIGGGNPKLIAAASTNNQAVTNIIDAFAKDFSLGKGPFAGRWLPDIKSFGSYFPASDKEKQAATKYQTRSFFSRIESPNYFAQAKSNYLAAAKSAYPNMKVVTVQDVVSELQAGLKVYEKTLTSIESNWNDLVVARQNVITLLGNTPSQELERIKNQITEATANIDKAKMVMDLWETIMANEKWWMTVFSWIPAVTTRRFIAAKLALKAVSVSVPSNTHSVDEITASLAAEINHVKAALPPLKQRLANGEAAIKNYGLALATWHSSIEPIVGRVPPNTNITINDVDKKADTEIRFKAFLLATHYWEGRWLLAMEALMPNIANEKSKNGETTVKPRWMRRMMITPCMVSTFYMLPSEMKISRYEADEFIPDYLYEFIDLLIVDEAGQVLPEVAAASFTLAKKALVIGDAMQIEPIWNLGPRVDIGNLLSANLLDTTQIQKDYNRLCHLGKTSAAGSVMRIAQCASRYHYDPDMARGMFLYEHRRCLDEIIGYSNDLCYRGKLIPMRGTAPKESPFPAMGYLHINGKCTQTSGGSRLNQLEAATIADWICENKDRLEGIYKGTKHSTIDQIVGVVSPFGGQVAAITEACFAKGLSIGKGEGELTVGTVHSLQGAERPIIIFSPAYSKHADGKFIDKRTSMLNVAVSRAKDSFLVFGDMDIFNPNDDSTPRGLLAKYLFSHPTNALTFRAMPRRDLAPSTQYFTSLLDADSHDEFLRDVLATATKEVNVVSPWLRKNRMEESHLLLAMANASTRGVKVTVYADQQLNQDGNNNHWEQVSDAFNQAGIALINVPRLHSKVVTKDIDVLCIGSFNWLSAARSGHYARHETSISYSGPAVAQEIQLLLESLVTRQ